MKAEWMEVVTRLNKQVGHERVLFNPSKDEFTQMLQDRSREIIVIELTHTKGAIKLKDEEEYSSRDLRKLDLSHIKYFITGMGTCSLPKLENGEFVATLKRSGVGLVNASYREISNEIVIKRLKKLIQILENPEMYNFPAYYLPDVIDQLIGITGSDTTNLGKLELLCPDISANHPITSFPTRQSSRQNRYSVTRRSPRIMGCQMAWLHEGAV